MSKNPPPIALDLFAVPVNVRGSEHEAPEPEGISEQAYQRLLDQQDRAREWAADDR